MKPQNSWLLILTVCFLLIGLVVTSQAKSRQAYLDSLSSQSQENLVILWRGLHEKTLSLRAELYNLQQEESVLLDQTTESRASLESILKELERIQLFNGDVAVTGPGIEVLLDANSPIIHLELLDIVNELWNSGAEAITVNDYRITSRTQIGTSVFSSEYYITINNIPVSYPISVKAIGNQQNLRAGLTITGGVIDTLNSFGIFPLIGDREELTLPKSGDSDNYKASS